VLTVASGLLEGGEVRFGDRAQLTAHRLRVSITLDVEGNDELLALTPNEFDFGVDRNQCGAAEGAGEVSAATPGSDIIIKQPPE
jgi:hypothetical protein